MCCCQHRTERELANEVISASLGTGCYRHIQIGANATLYKLHQAILKSFDFEDNHEHASFMDNHVWSSADVYFSTSMGTRDRRMGAVANLYGLISPDELYGLYYSQSKMVDMLPFFMAVSVSDREDDNDFSGKQGSLFRWTEKCGLRAVRGSRESGPQRDCRMGKRAIYGRFVDF